MKADEAKIRRVIVDELHKAMDDQPGNRQSRIAYAIILKDTNW